jgi:hypothetical protein
MEIIKRLIVPVPPLSLQEEFAGMVARAESLRGRMEGLYKNVGDGSRHGNVRNELHCWQYTE